MSQCWTHFQFLLLLSLQKQYLVMTSVVDAIWVMMLHSNAQSPKPLCSFPGLGYLCHLSHQNSQVWQLMTIPCHKKNSAPLLNFVYFLRPPATLVLCACLSLCVYKSQEGNPPQRLWLHLCLLPVPVEKLIDSSLPGINSLLYLPLFSCLETTCLILGCGPLGTDHSFLDQGPLSANRRVLGGGLYLTPMPGVLEH